jgi:hypothetical protein
MLVNATGGELESNCSERGRPADAEYGAGIHFLLEPHCAFAFSNSREWNSKVYLVGRKVRGDARGSI